MLSYINTHILPSFRWFKCSTPKFGVYPHLTSPAPPAPERRAQMLQGETQWGG